MAIEKSKGTGVAEIPEPVEGLEDVGAGDVLLPIIKINHTEGVFVDSLSNETFEEFDAIMLGLVKSRVMWATEVEDGAMPICRALDFRHGRPTEKFLLRDSAGPTPVKISKFSKERAQKAIEAAALGPRADLDDLLPCGQCNLKEWDTNPSGSTPWCAEQFIFPILRIMDDGGHAPGYITFQRASAKACKAYISAFKQAKKPMYTVVTRIKAIHQKRGNVMYVTPQFTKGAQTDPEMWADFSLALAEIRSFLTTPRVRDDETATTDEDEDVDETPKSNGKSKVIDTTATDDDDDDDDDDDEPTPVPVAAGADDDEDDEYGDEEPF